MPQAFSIIRLHQAAAEIQRGGGQDAHDVIHDIRWWPPREGKERGSGHEGVQLGRLQGRKKRRKRRRRRRRRRKMPAPGQHRAVLPARGHRACPCAADILTDNS